LRNDDVRSPGHRLLVGLLVIALGVLLFLQEIHFPHAHRLLEWFGPAALIAFGVSLLARRSCGSFWGWVSLAVGGVLAARLLGAPFPSDLWDVLWPVFLIVFGIHLVTRSGRRFPRKPAGFAEAARRGDSEAFVSQTAVFASHEIRSESDRFAGGRLSAVFGTCTLDLTGARAAPEGALVQVSAVFGSIAIRVPEAWNVESRVTPLLGGFEDKRRRVPGTPATGSLTIVGASVFGGVEVTN